MKPEGGFDMKKNATVFWVLAGIVVSLILFVLLEFSPNESIPEKPSLQAVKASIGTKEDPVARARFEWMRLRDPKTDRIPPKIRTKELRPNAGDRNAAGIPGSGGRQG